MSIGKKVWGILALFAATLTAEAKPIDILGAQVDLPFEFTVLSTEDARNSGSAFSASQRKELEIRDEAGKTHQVMLFAVYVTSARVSNAALEEFVDKDASEAAAEKGVRESASLKVDGFSFHFIDGPIDNKKYPQRMSLYGVINGAVYRLILFVPEQRFLTADIAGRLKAAKIDYVGLLKIKPEFEEEAKLAVIDDTLDTPLSRIKLDEDTRARLSSSTMLTGADGAPLYRSRNFALFKAGLWTMQSLGVSVGCGRESALDEDERRSFLAMNEKKDGEDEDEEDKERYTNVSAPQPATLAGLPAEMVSAKGEKVNALRSLAVKRWQAQKEGTLYRVAVVRLNGSPVEKLLIGQLQTAAPMCQLGLQFGARRTQ